jgi:hypothetical protein
MAKIDNTNKSKKNTNKMPKGTMPKDKLTRFKLKGNIDEPGEYKHRSISDIKIVARSARAIKSYRMYVHGCNEARLPSSLRGTVHYFLTPMSRMDSDNSKDRKSFVVETDNSSTLTNNT